MLCWECCIQFTHEPNEMIDWKSFNTTAPKTVSKSATNASYGIELIVFFHSGSAEPRGSSIYVVGSLKML